MDSNLRVLFLERIDAEMWLGDQRLYLETCLREAIPRNELMVHFQPQYEVESGRGCGVEALARWNLADGEEVPPAVFIPIAERIGVIRALGAWVLQRACETAHSWHSLGGCPVTLCVNVSAQQISEDFGAVIERVLDATGFPATRLELEITESALIGNMELAIECMEHWKELGVRIAVDDFGTGYSSLSYLSRLPVDRLKLDKSFVHRMIYERKTAAIVRSVLALGREMGVAVIAEGVETERQFELLEHLGCRQVQGFLLAKPGPAHEAQALLTARWGTRSMPIFQAECADSRGTYAA
jgi:EAL domain-containing protein (putative c-di-GMP-specific phosphodiesterase class I)